MHARALSILAAGLVGAGVAVLTAQQGGGAAGGGGAAAAGGQGQARAGTGQRPDDDVKHLVAQLDLEKFKATLKGLTQFGDRREGTQRNRDAVTWIEAQLRSYGCAD